MQNPSSPTASMSISNKKDEFCVEFKVKNLSDKSYYIIGQIPANVSPLFGAMLQEKPAETSTVIVMGREYQTPRYAQHYLKTYKYAGKSHDAKDLPEIFRPLLEWCNSMLSKGKFTPGKIPDENIKFNQALVNFYMNGEQYIGRHSDDERQLVDNGVIFSASFGEKRIFRIRSKKCRTIVQDIELEDGTFVVMCGCMQKEFTHEVPKVLGKKGEKLNPRINVTFRIFK